MIKKGIIILSDGVSYDADSVADVVETIKEEYARHDICMGELLNDISIIGCSVQECVDIFATLMSSIEEDELLQINKEEQTCFIRGLSKW